MIEILDTSKKETNTIETLFEEARQANLPVYFDKNKQRLVFMVRKNQYADVFQFMDAHKVQTDKGLVYPVTFAVFPEMKKQGFMEG